MKVQADVITTQRTSVIIDPQDTANKMYTAWLRSIKVPTDSYINGEGVWVSQHSCMFPRERTSNTATAEEVAISEAHLVMGRMLYRLVRSHPELLE
jgi:hypothetical protein